MWLGEFPSLPQAESSPNSRKQWFAACATTFEKGESDSITCLPASECRVSTIWDLLDVLNRPGFSGDSNS